MAIFASGLLDMSNTMPPRQNLRPVACHNGNQNYLLKLLTNVACVGKDAGKVCFQTTGKNTFTSSITAFSITVITGKNI